jgi:carbonic anhydrase
MRQRKHRAWQEYAMEMHLVHKNASGELTVVAVMFDKGARTRSWKNCGA